MQASLGHLRNLSVEIREEDEARLSQLPYDHINMIGYYSFTLAGQRHEGKTKAAKSNIGIDPLPLTYVLVPLDFRPRGGPEYVIDVKTGKIISKHYQR